MNGKLIDLKDNNFFTLSIIIGIQTIIWLVSTYYKKTSILFLLIPLTTIGVLPIFSVDSYFYIDKIAQWSLYHENPYYITSALSRALLPYFSLYKETFIANAQLIYGPLWLIIVSGIGVMNTHIHEWYKFFSILCIWVTSWCIYRYTEKPYYAYIFAASPIVMYEAGIDAHNDILMILFTVTSLYAIKQKNIITGILLFTCAILIKYSIIIFAPFLLWYLIQNKLLNRSTILYGVGGSALIIMACVSVFYRDFHFFDGFVFFLNSGHYLNSGILAYILFHILNVDLNYFGIIKIIFSLIWFILFVYIHRHKCELASCISWSTGLYILITIIFSYWAMPWYLLLPFVMFLINKQISHVYIIIGAWAMMVLTQYGFISSTLLLGIYIVRYIYSNFGGTNRLIFPQKNTIIQ